nr:unnamed protein product [Callosobruchus analis]
MNHTHIGHRFVAEDGTHTGTQRIETTWRPARY